MTLESMAAWLLAAMIAWNPPAQHREGEQAATTRYDSIAHDIASVSLEPDEAPLFDGPVGRAQTALLIASVASFESTFRKDVDTGTLQGDHGRSWCILQIQVYGKTAEDWTGQQLVEDRKRCVKAGLHRMRQSFTMCKHLPLIDRLAGYTLGQCKEEPKAEWRTRRALGWWKGHPFVVTES